jgi:hypothetical protein
MRGKVCLQEMGQGMSRAHHGMHGHGAWASHTEPWMEAGVALWQSSRFLGFFLLWDAPSRALNT